MTATEVTSASPIEGSVEAAGERPVARSAGTTGRWLLPEGSRLLHIGPPLTGGAAVRAGLTAAAGDLAEQGVEVVDAGDDWGYAATVILTSTAPRVIVSSDTLAGADAPTIHAIVEDLGPERLHVVATLRPLSEVLRRHWQQLLLEGSAEPFAEWLAPTLAAGTGGDVRGFWAAQRHDLVLARWSTALGPDRITAIVTGEGRRVAGTLEALLGLRRRTLTSVATPEDRMLTQPELEVMRALNRSLRKLELAEGRWDGALEGLIPQLLARTPRPEEPSLELPAWAQRSAADLARAIVASVAASGVGVVGDLEELLVPLAEPPDAAAAIDDSTWADIGAHAAAGVLDAAGLLDADRAPMRRAEPLEVAGMSTPRLGLVLARRLLAAIANRARERAPEPGPAGDD